jgi:uncharacterized protein
MRYNVSQLLKEPIGSSRSYKIEESEEFPYSGDVVLLRIDEGLLVSGSLVTELQSVCGRCLCDYSEELPVNFDEEFHSHPQEGEFVIDEHQEIDLSEVARQYTLLATPMKPLCSEDCAGLCPRCGKNLNLGACGCRKEIDPRLAVLANLSVN